MKISGSFEWRGDHCNIGAILRAELGLKTNSQIPAVTLFLPAGKEGTARWSLTSERRTEAAARTVILAWGDVYMAEKRRNEEVGDG